MLGSMISVNPARLSSVVGALFPRGVFAAEMREAGDPAQLLPEEREFLGKYVQKRVQEFTAGRLCARCVLMELGVTNFALGVAQDGQPIWPSDVVGSITHTRGLCVAVACSKKLVRGIGVDCEAGPIGAEIWPSICTATESAWIASLRESERQAAVTLIFSAKESFYKCQYSITREWLDFHDISIEAVDGGAFGWFTVRSNRPLAAAIGGEEWSGRYLLQDRLITTGIVIPN
jgi:4'-phosphopantetheinyl transferase EntD